MRKSELQAWSRQLEPAQRVSNPRLAYAIGKTNNKVTSELKHLNASIKPTEEYDKYQQERKKVAERFAKKDKKGNPIRSTDSDHFIIDPKKKESYRSAIEKTEKKFQDVIDKRNEQKNLYNSMLRERVDFDEIAYKVDEEHIPEDVKASVVIAAFPILKTKKIAATEKEFTIQEVIELKYGSVKCGSLEGKELGLKLGYINHQAQEVLDDLNDKFPMHYPELEDYEEQREIICKDHAKKDGEGRPQTKKQIDEASGQYVDVYDIENQEAFNAELRTLAKDFQVIIDKKNDDIKERNEYMENTKVTLKIPKLSLEEFTDNVTAEQITPLIEIIDDIND